MNNFNSYLIKQGKQQISIWKIGSSWSRNRRCWDSTACLGERTKHRAQMIPDRDSEHRELWLTAGGNAKCASTWGRDSTVSHKPNVPSSCCPTMELPCIYPKEEKAKFSWTLSVSVCSRLISNYQTWTTKHLSADEWVNKLWSIQTIYYSVIKRKGLPSHEKMREQLQCILLDEKARQKGYAPCDSSCVSFWKKWKYRDSKMITRYQQLDGEETEVQSFSAQWRYSANPVMDMCHYTFIQIHWMRKTKSEPVSHGRE